MNRSGAVLATLLTLTLFAACGNKQETPPAEQPPPAETVSPPPAAAAVPEPESQPAEAEDAEAIAVPESVSETEDGQTSESATATTAQPSIRLGGPSSTAPTSAKFRDGTHYTRIVPIQPTSVAPGKVEVVEVFWYGCGHCFTLDPLIESWRSKGKAEYVEFTRVPAMWNDSTRMHARVYYTAELLGKLEELHTPIFRAVNIENNPLNTVDRITAFFRSHGVSSDDFQKAFSSFSVESKLQRADFLNRRYRIESVPTLVINGKYKTDLGMAGGEPQQLFELIGELAASEHGG